MMNMTSIYIASDHGGFDLKNYLIKELGERGHKIEDCGCYSPRATDYPVYAKLVCEKVQGESAMGILICGTGVGMSIAANRQKGIRASVVGDVYTAEATREHNDSNVLCLGQRVLGPSLALMITETWLTTPFTGGKHQNRINMIDNKMICE